MCLGKNFICNYCIYIIPSLCAPIWFLLCAPSTPQIRSFLFFNYNCYSYTYTWIYRYNLLKLLSITHIHAGLGLVTWNRISYGGAHSWRRLFFPPSACSFLYGDGTCESSPVQASMWISVVIFQILCGQLSCCDVMGVPSLTHQEDTITAADTLVLWFLESFLPFSNEESRGCYAEVTS